MLYHSKIRWDIVDLAEASKTKRLVQCQCLCGSKRVTLQDKCYDARISCPDFSQAQMRMKVIRHEEEWSWPWKENDISDVRPMGIAEDVMNGILIQVEQGQFNHREDYLWRFPGNNRHINPILPWSKIKLWWIIHWYKALIYKNEVDIYPGLIFFVTSILLLVFLYKSS